MKHPQAIVETDHVGEGTRIWAFAHLLPGAIVGKDCNICDQVFIENQVTVGDRVTIKSGVQLWDGVHLEDDVFIGPNVTFTNDPFPRSTHHLAAYPETWVRRGASIGANATILPGLTIGAGAMVGAGSVVTRSVPSHAVVAGNPARILRYVTSAPSGSSAKAPAGGRSAASAVRGVSLIEVPLIEDLRGNLVAREIGKGFPFVPARCFLIFDVKSKEVRGEHAHRKCDQLLVCVQGSVVAVCDDGHHRQEFQLDASSVGLSLPAMVWGTQYRYTPDALLLVFASRVYEPDDYIRDYDRFLVERRRYEEQRDAAGGSNT
jgi:acetyltransferase-like isoleucine patch superfamily enzyme/dTDP-4-dehydrorhamnose 3,5-epimerase-like enzyme